MFICVPHVFSAYEGRKASEPLGPELWALVKMPNVKARSNPSPLEEKYKLLWKLSSPLISKFLTQVSNEVVYRPNSGYLV